MTLRRTYPRVLIVEGKDELRVLPELLELAGIPWPKGNEPVRIEEQDGIGNILEPGFIETTLKASGVTAVGIVVDANGDPASRWEKLRSRLAVSYPEFPLELPATGVIHQVTDKPRVGVWVMPDNVRAGMLETLLLALRVGDQALHDLMRETRHTRPACSVHHSATSIARRPNCMPGSPGRIHQVDSSTTLCVREDCRRHHR